MVQLPEGVHLPAWMGVQIHKAQAGRALVTLDERAELLNYRQVVHGGTLTTLADVAMIVAVASATDAGAVPVTSDIFITFLAPGRGRMTARGEVVRAGGATAVAQVGIENDAGVLVAKAMGTFRILRPDRSNGPVA